MIPADINVHLVWCASDLASAKVLTTAMAATDGVAALQVAPWNVVQLFPVLSGTAVTSLELLVELSADGTNWNPVPTKALGVGTVLCDPAEISLRPDASDRFPCVDIDVAAARYLRVSAKRTGGDGTSALLLRACGGSLR